MHAVATVNGHFVFYSFCVACIQAPRFVTGNFMCNIESCPHCTGGPFNQGVGLSVSSPGQMRRTVTWLSTRDSRWMGWAIVWIERLHWAVWPGGAHQSGRHQRSRLRLCNDASSMRPSHPWLLRCKGLPRPPVLSAPSPLSSIMRGRSMACNRFQPKKNIQKKPVNEVHN